MHYIVGLLISAYQGHLHAPLHSHLMAICVCRKLKGVIGDDAEGEDDEMSAVQEEDELQGRKEIEKELRSWKKYVLCMYRVFKTFSSSLLYRVVCDLKTS